MIQLARSLACLLELTTDMQLFLRILRRNCFGMIALPKWLPTCFSKKIKFDFHDNKSSLSGVSYTKEIMLISLSENKMKKIIATTLLTITFAATAEASCFGTKAFMTCSDGNNYSTIGSTTFGSNSNTGSSWSQTTIGNHTFGSSSTGASWNSYNNGSSSWGTDSRGNSWSCVGNFCN